MPPVEVPAAMLPVRVTGDSADGAMLLPFIAVGLRLAQGFLTCRSDEIFTVAQFDSPLLEQIITGLGKHDMLGLFLDGTRLR